MAMFNSFLYVYQRVLVIQASNLQNLSQTLVMRHRALATSAEKTFRLKSSFTLW
jgi:hypothetical protein